MASGVGAQSVTVKSTGCGFYLEEMKFLVYLHLYFHFFALVSKNWGTECRLTLDSLCLPCVRDTVQREADLI